MERKSKTKSNRNLTIVEKTIYPIYNPLTNKIKRNSIANLEIFLSGYQKISSQKVLAIISKNKKLRMDIENRMVADYLSNKFNYFKKIKDESTVGYVRLIATLKLEAIPADEIIINIGDENNNLYIIFEGSVIVYRENKHFKKMQLYEIREYLRALYDKNKEKYKYITKKNNNLEINFDVIIKDEYKVPSSNKFYNFYYEELEEMGTYKEGFSFGETELIKKTNRELIIKTVTDCKLLYVNKFDYNRILQTTEEKALEKKADTFTKNFPLFKKWTIEQLVKLFNYFVHETCYKEDFIYKQNEENEYLYFLEEGTVMQYANVSFSWYKEYIDYVKNFNNNLLEVLLKLKNRDKNDAIIEDVNKYLKGKIENIRDKINEKNYKEKFPFLNINKIYLERKKDFLEISQLYKKEKSIDNFFKIKFDENELNFKEKLYKIPISSTKVPTIFGFEEIFELKNRLTTVACLSDQVKLKKIKLIDLLNILYSYKEYDYIETFFELIIQKKLILSEIIRTNMKKCADDFEKYMKSRYEKIIKSSNIITSKDDESIIVDEKKQDEAIVTLRLKGWNNGLYLDNILDTNLNLFKPRSKKIIKLEENKKCKTLNHLYKIKTITNEKTLHSTMYSFDKFFKKNQINKIQFLKSISLNKSKHKSIKNLKSVSIKQEKAIKPFFKTNTPLDEGKIIFDKIKKKCEKENKNEKNVSFKPINNTSPANIFIPIKKRPFKKLINYKVSEEFNEENNKEQSSKSNNKNENGYLNLNSGSIWTRSRDIDYLPTII